MWVEDGWFEAASPGPESDWTLGLGEAACLLQAYRLNQPSLHALGERELLHVTVAHQAMFIHCNGLGGETGREERRVGYCCCFWVRVMYEVCCCGTLLPTLLAQRLVVHDNHR